MDTEQQLQEKLDEFERRIRDLETRQLNQQQIRPNAIRQSHIFGGMIIFTGLASARPSNGSTEQQAFWSTDTHVLSIWDSTALVWRTVTLT